MRSIAHVDGSGTMPWIDWFAVTSPSEVKFWRNWSELAGKVKAMVSLNRSRVSLDYMFA
jgi:hypothetical protein